MPLFNFFYLTVSYFPTQSPVISQNAERRKRMRKKEKGEERMKGKACDLQRDNALFYKCESDECRSWWSVRVMSVGAGEVGESTEMFSLSRVEGNGWILKSVDGGEIRWCSLIKTQWGNELQYNNYTIYCTNQSHSLRAGQSFFWIKNDKPASVWGFKNSFKGMNARLATVYSVIFGYTLIVSLIKNTVPQISWKYL
jgi:hypothetical protein